MQIMLTAHLGDVAAEPQPDDTAGPAAAIKGVTCVANAAVLPLNCLSSTAVLAAGMQLILAAYNIIILAVYIRYTSLFPVVAQQRSERSSAAAALLLDRFDQSHRTAIARCLV
jgi:hypothetical protein